MTTVLLFLSAIIIAAGSYPYITAVMRGSVRPRLVSWSVWAVLAGITTASALIDGQIASAVLSVQGLVVCTIVVILGWKRGNVSLSKLDIVCLIGAVIGIMSLIWLRNPTVAIFVAITVDAMAFIPTLLHAWTDPDEESIACFACSAVGAVLVFFVALQNSATVTGLAYPIYAIVFNAAMTGLLIVSRLMPSTENSYVNEEV